MKALYPAPVEKFEKDGMLHTTNTKSFEKVLDYCIQNKISFSLQAVPGKFFLIRKGNPKRDPDFYTSTGDPEVTRAIKYALWASQREKNFGGPHRWNNIFLRYVGRLMARYARFAVEEERKNATNKNTGTNSTEDKGGNAVQ